MTRILVIDDDPSLTQLMSMRLEKSGNVVFTANSGAEGLELARFKQPEVVILDVSMPEMDGFNVCKELREFSGVPVLFLTAFSQEEDMLAGFAAGADDYMRKPFSMRELEARITALYMRSQRSTAVMPNFSFRDAYLSADLFTGKITVDGKPVHLTPIEFKILRCLIQNKGTVMPPDEIIQEVWGDNYLDATNSLSVYMRYLREKIEAEPSHPRYLHTKWGKGYYFRPPLK